MKITQFNLKIFVDELRILSEEIPKVKETAEKWLEYQEQREKYGWQDQYGTAAARNRLENRLTQIRQRLATIYDFMGDRGLVNFEPTAVGRSENGRERDELGGDSPSSEGTTPEAPQAHGASKLVQRLRERNQGGDESQESSGNSGG